LNLVVEETSSFMWQLYWALLMTKYEKINTFKMADDRRIENRFSATTQQPVVRFEWHFARGRSFTKNFCSETDSRVSCKQERRSVERNTSCKQEVLR